MQVCNSNTILLSYCREFFIASQFIQAEWRKCTWRLHWSFSYAVV